MNKLVKLMFSTYPALRNYHALRRYELITARARMDKLIERETGVKPSVNIKDWLNMMLDLE